MILTFRMLKPDLNSKNSDHKLALASIEFTKGLLKGIRLIGFTVVEGEEGLFVLFPSYISKKDGKKNTFNFLREMEKGVLEELEGKILDEYEKQLDKHPIITHNSIRYEE